jgi:hypothetical protein
VPVQDGVSTIRNKAQRKKKRKQKSRNARRSVTNYACARVF